ncbi:TetR/AcrR family transcriptional regulator [Lentzea albida]|uniref:Transcriptional regulator, TetR family n=1 Tax=Lentzea albida TaxID=65499 RepID=A0A1H9E774_9PSEU|nr:TetR/AcrR family transcriptional regulator [Lentzea albida]SEQ21452.1 transcriptional regulator, TetR family [Lentzea albida]
MNQPGESLRDRKKRRTRAALERATVRLAAVKGYDHVTVEEIAAEADVSVRTFFNYFASKDEALIGADPEVGPRMAERVLAFPDTVTPFEAYRCSVLAEITEELDSARELWLLRKEVLMQRPDLLVRAFASGAESEQLLASAVARRAELPEDHLYPRLLVSAGSVAFRCAVTRWALDDSLALGDLVTEAFDLFGAGLAHVPHHREGGS